MDEDDFLISSLRLTVAQWAMNGGRLEDAPRILEEFKEEYLDTFV